MRICGPVRMLIGAVLALAWPAAGGVAPGREPARTIHFAAEDWPPFVTATLADNGWSGTVMAAVYRQLGYRTSVQYFPWKRAMELGLHDARYAGFAPVWRTPEREKLCHFSAPIGQTQTVLAYLKTAPLRPGSVAELRHLRIGSVAGYAYDGALEAMAARGQLTLEAGVNDQTNLRKLLIGRYPVIVIEKHVLRHLLASKAFSAQERRRIGYSDSVFQERPVYVCFKRDAQGRAQQRAFNEAARQLDLDKIERDYWRRIGEADSAPPRKPGGLHLSTQAN